MNIGSVSIVCLFVVALASNVLAQTPTPAAKVYAPKPEDVASMDSVLRAMYNSISGPIGQKRDWDRYRSLFAPNVRFQAAFRAKNGDIHLYNNTVDGYITQSGGIVEAKGFFAREIARHVDTYANISQVFSTYETRWKPDDKKPFARGINSFQLMNDGKRWWIVSAVWQSEDEKNPIPPEWLGH